MSAVEANHRTPLSLAIKEETSALHREAERTGIVKDILRGTASRRAYVQYLRNLLPAYETLEAALECRVADRTLAHVFDRSVFRANALKSDLAAIAGDDWASELTLVPAGRRYAEHLETVAEREPVGLMAHAYARYLGDLSGGQIMRRLIARTLGLEPGQLAFYDFPLIGDPDAYKQQFRNTLDRIGENDRDYFVILTEAREAFFLNIALSSAITEPDVKDANVAGHPRL